MPADLYEREGNKLRFHLHAGQTRAHRSQARFILVLAGTQGGKTSYGPLWLHREIERTKSGKNDDYIAATSSYDLFKLKMLPEMRTYFCECLGWEYLAGDKVIQGPEGIRIILRSAQSEGGLESTTAKGAWLDEWGQDCVDVAAWEAVQRRLSIHQGRVLFTTTPYNIGWLKQQVFDRWVGGDADYEVVNFKSLDNPSFPMAEYERAQRTLPAWKFEMFYNGVFTRPAGLIFSDYEDSYATFEEIQANPQVVGPGCFVSGGNLVRPFPIPSHWLRDIGVDFGESAHCARVWSAEDPVTHCIYIYRDALGGGLNGPEYAREALEYAEPIRDSLGGAASEGERRIQWARAGLPVREPQIAEVEAGIDHANSLFKQRRAFVFDTCTGLRSELGTYSRELDASGEPTAKIADKAKFHRVDAWRYLASRFPQDAPLLSMPQVTEVQGRTRNTIRNRNKQFERRETDEYI